MSMARSEIAPYREDSLFSTVFRVGRLSEHAAAEKEMS